MADYTVSTNLISWIPASHDIFGWPDDGAEAETIRGMEIGDLIVPKFAQSPVHEGQEPYQRSIAEVYGESWDAHRSSYVQTVSGGAGAVPFVMRVAGRPRTERGFPSDAPWVCVDVALHWLDHPLSTSEFLHLRVVPVEIARQFKGMAAPNKHIQPLPIGAGEKIRAIGRSEFRDPLDFRRESLVRARTAEEARTILIREDYGPDPFDRCFLVTGDTFAGLHVVDVEGQMRSAGEPIDLSLSEIAVLLDDARHKAIKKDDFRPSRAFDAVAELTSFLESGEKLRPIEEFRHFHDRYVILPRKINEAIEIASRPDSVRRSPPEDSDLGDVAKDDDLVADVADLTEDQLQGLSIEAVRAQLGGLAIARSVLAEAVTALRSGKHLILSGPPGTGKSTIASALCRAVVDTNYRVATATADWTTFDTIGGYLPQESNELEFEPGIVLQCIGAGDWLVIDELNRADIDKAFGPLFTLLAGSGTAQETVLLPFRREKKHVEIAWAGAPGAAKADYRLTEFWRLIGTMNVTDKASLFQLSFAFLRRFAVIDVPLPDDEDYRQLFGDALAEAQLEDDVRAELVEAAMVVAFGPVELGPAILLDIATFTRRGLVKTSSGAAPYDEPRAAFITAVRLYAAPQYEGATAEHRDQLLDHLGAALGPRPNEAWNALERALRRITA